ncbi:MAG: hypothetical protein ABI591_34095 [Kofleriaceae bacterium]
MKRVQLFDRLPAIHKIKDEELEGPLQAYLAPVETAFNAVKDGIDALYHDLFIDTCADWVIPYIGDLLGTSHLAGDPWTLRADVADTILLRRAKGTLGAIERLAHDLTGWGAFPVELRENLVWAQALNHQRPDRGGAPAYAIPPYGRHTVIRGGFATIRDPAVLSQLGTAYDTFARFPDVSTVRPYNLQYNLPNLAVFLWRLASYEVELEPTLASPAPATTSAGGTFVARFFVHPLGRPVRMFGRSTYEPDRRPIVLTPLDEQPSPIPRARLGPEPADPIGVANPAAYVEVLEYDPAVSPIPVGDLPIQLHVPINLFTAAPVIRGANLCAWEGGLAPALAPNEIAIDPVIGRIAIGVSSQAQADQLVAQLVLTYRYAAVGPVGAHPVGRDPLPAGTPAAIVVPSAAAPTLADALAGLATISDAPLVIELDDDAIHDFDGGDLVVGRPLILRAAEERRPLVRLKHPLSFGTASLDDHVANTTVRIEGIMFTAGDGWADSDPLIARVAIEALDLRGCTLDPGGYRVLDGSPTGSRAKPRTAMRLAADYGFAAADLAKFDAIPSIELTRTIAGPLLVDADAYTIALASSIIDASDLTAPAIGGDTTPYAAKTQIDGVTIFGTTLVQRISGRGGIFTGTLTVDDDQTGCLKLCWFSNQGDRLPQNSECLKAQDARLVFTSEVFGHEAYAQLALDCDPRILNRGPDDDQMGAYGFLLEAHKWANLTIRLREFTPVGVRPLLIPAT